jgi:hypothetical protein
MEVMVSDRRDSLAKTPGTTWGESAGREKSALRAIWSGASRADRVWAWGFFVRPIIPSVGDDGVLLLRHARSVREVRLGMQEGQADPEAGMCGTAEGPLETWPALASAVRRGTLGV